MLPGSYIFSTAGDHVDENFYYVTGLSKIRQVSGAVIVTKKGNVVLTNILEHGLFKGKKIILKERKDTIKAFRKYTGKTVGLNFSSMSANELKLYRKLLKGKKIVDISKDMFEKRSVKTREEIKKIKHACKITTDVLDDIDKLLKKSKTEKDLAMELECAARRNGAEAISFATIVAAGKGSALPHYALHSKKIGKGLLLIDFGVVHDGYCSDITRTFCVGRADQRTQYVYKSVYSAQQAAMKKVKSGAKASDVHNAASRVLKDTLGQELVHSLGHGLGIEVHDCFGVNQKSKLVLKNNMVMTVEPGYYNKAWGGIRIEDDVVVRHSALQLSKAPNEIIEI